MNSACISIGNSAHQFCDSTADSCDQGTDMMILALSPIMYSLFSLGALYLVDGTIQLTDKAIKLICACKKKPRPSIFPAIIQEVDEEPPRQSCWQRVKGAWNSVFKIGRSVSQAALCASFALPLFFIIKELPKTCDQMRNGCPGFNATVAGGCNWTESFILNVINDAVNQQLEKFPSLVNVSITLPTIPPSIEF